MKRAIVFLLIVKAALVFGQDIRTGAIERGIFLQEGIASWYGAEFNGRPTASGEIFNDSLLTAAHPILPFGTVLKITNKHNNKTVTVRVNDRGPFVAARIIDLSRAAAVQLDMVSTGTAPVSVESLDIVSLPSRQQPAAAVIPAAPVSPQPVAVPLREEAKVPYTGTVLPAQPGETVQIRSASVAPYSGSTSAALDLQAETRQQPGSARFQPAIPELPTGKQYRIQVGAYKQPQHAVEAFEKLKTAGFVPAYEKFGDYYRVVLAGLKQEELKNMAERLGTAGFRDVLLREEK